MNQSKTNRGKKNKDLLGIILLVGAIVFITALYVIGYFSLQKEVKHLKHQHNLMQTHIAAYQLEKTFMKEVTSAIKYVGEFKLTFYTPHELGASSAKQLRTATGTIPKEGRTIAVDTRIIPKNSLVYIEGWGYYIAEDTGGAIKNNRIDIYLDSHHKAIQLGNNKRARVFIIKKGTTV